MQLPDIGTIQRIRKKQGLTQTELAKKAGVSQSLIARIESGTVDPSYSKIAKIFSVLYEDKKKALTAKDIMSKEVVKVDVGETLGSAITKMKEYNVSQLPVYDKSKQVGSISEGVILDQISRGADMNKISKKNVLGYMEEPFPVMDAKTGINAITWLLDHSKAVLVTEEGRIKGVITKADLLKVV